MSVALQYAKEDGLCPLGQYIYYDALVVHGDAFSLTEDQIGSVQ